MHGVNPIVHLKNSNGVHPPLDYHRITPHIFIGTNQCCQMHFDETLLKKGITADISLEKTRVDAPFGVDFYLWLPIADHTPPTMDQLRLGVAALDALIHIRRKVYVHCKNGHGRAPTLVAAYLISKGKSVIDAIRLLQHRRPSVHLEPSQRRALERWAKRIR